MGPAQRRFLVNAGVISKGVNEVDDRTCSETVMAAGADAASAGRARAPASVHTPGTAPPKLSVQETGVCLAAEANTAILPPPPAPPKKNPTLHLNNTDSEER